MRSSSRLLLVALAIVMALVVAACGSDPTPTPEATATPTPTTSGSSDDPTPTSAPQGFEADWQSLIEAAQQEGELVVVFGGSASRLYRPVTDYFSDKFDIDVIFNGGSGSQQTNRILAEQSAGEYAVDVLMIGGTSAERLIDGEALQEIRPFLMHPEVLDESAWFGGNLNFSDGPQKFAINHSASAEPFTLSMRYNTNEVTQEDIDGWESVFDFFDPKWRGRIASLPPTTGGAGGTYYRVWANPVVDAEALLREWFDPEMEVFFSEDFGLITDGVVGGKYAFAIGIGSAGRDIDDLGEEGAPVEALYKPLEEGFDLSGSGSSNNLQVPKNVPNPNATKLFVNWMLTREGQRMAMELPEGDPDPTLRTDIPCEFPGSSVRPQDCRDPNRNYFYSTGDPESVAKRSEYLDRSREIYRELRGG